jgi:dipeptidyl aminopeptidase/acylaminoacyl peptidase
MLTRVTVDIDGFLRSTSATAAAFSPDGTRLAFVSNVTGLAQAYIVPVDGSEPPEQLTDGSDRVSSLAWSPADPGLLIFGRDAGGNEMHQLFELRLDRSTTPISDAPAAMHELGAWSRDGALIAFRTNRRNGTDFDVVVRELATGRERTVWSEGGYCAPAGFASDLGYLAVLHHNTNVDNDCYLLDVSGAGAEAWWTDDRPLARRHTSAHEDVAYFGAPRWAADSAWYFFIGDAGADLQSLRRYDLATGVTTVAFASDWEVESAALSRDARRLAVVVNADGYSRVHLFAVAADGTLTEQAPPQLPTEQATGLFWSQDGQRLGYTGYGSTTATNAWVWGAEPDTASPVARARSAAALGVDPARLAVPDLVRYTSFDGLSVPFFRYQPSEPASGRQPVVIEIHGGPEGQSRPQFNPVGQYLVARGYVLLTPNVRGSAGYGKAYLALDDRRLRLDSVADLAALHAWIAEQPELDESRVALYGGSYGGYMVLAGLAFQPELWAGGVDIVGIANLESFLENTSSYRRALRESEYGYLATDRDFLRAASPINRVEQITAPLLIIHGANDPRVPLSEAEQMHAALAARGVTTDLLVYPDEGHGLAKLANRLDAYPKVAAFLDRVIGT